MPRAVPSARGAVSLRGWCAFLGAASALWAQPSATAPTAVAQRAVIEGLRQAPHELKLLDLSGRDATAHLRPALQDGQLTVAPTQREPFIVKPNRIDTVVAAHRTRVTLPGGMVVPVGDPASPKLLWYRLTFEASPLPAPWDAASGGYVTRLSFGLTRPAELPAELAPERQVTVKLSFDGLSADDVPPLVLDAAGLEHEKSIELRFRALAPELRVLVRSTLSDADLALRALPRLELRPQQRHALGFGLESVPVTLASVLPHGELRPVAADTLIALEVDGRARAEPAHPMLRAGAATTVFNLRTAGLGDLQLAATADGLMGGAVIEQRFPFGPLVATILGGALGGYARRFLRGSRRNLTARRCLEGVVVGLIAFVAGVLGVGYLDLPAALIATEAGAFLVAAVAGFVGVTVIERIAGSKTPA